MAFVHKELGGSIFRNDRRTNDSQPTHKGDCKIEGVDYWISAWTNETKDGKGKYFGLKFEKKEEQGPAAAPPVPPEDLDDDIPF